MSCALDRNIGPDRPDDPEPLDCCTDDGHSLSWFWNGEEWRAECDHCQTKFRQAPDGEVEEL